MKEFKKFDEDREIMECESGLVIIRATDHQEVIPLFCPCCSYPMKTQEDFLCYRELKCCELCNITFAKTNMDNWNNGWRPDKTTELWKEFLFKKDLSSRRQVSFK